LASKLPRMLPHWFPGKKRSKRMKKQLEPLIPLDDLKSVVKGLMAVPKSEIDKAEAERPRRKRGKSSPRT
jgi:hypothetical protein